MVELLRRRKPKLITRIKKKVGLIKRKRPLGKWCKYYVGRIPYPIECMTNSRPPACIYRPECPECDRKIDFKSWKKGYWNNIIYAISKGTDFSDGEIKGPVVTYEEN